MIRIMYRREGDSHTLTMEGHADYAGHGADIVCAGASAIVCSLLGWLENNSEDLECCDSDVRSGSLRLYCEGGERTATAFEVTIIGLLQMEDSYKDHMEIQTIGLAD